MAGLPGSVIVFNYKVLTNTFKMVLDYKPRGDGAPNLGNSGFDRIRTLTARVLKCI